MGNGELVIAHGNYQLEPGTGTWKVSWDLGMIILMS